MLGSLASRLLVLALVPAIAVSCGSLRSQKAATKEGNPTSPAASIAASMSTGELRLQVTKAGAEDRVVELAVFLSALEGRKAIKREALVVIIDGLRADQLESFVQAAREGSITATLASTRLSAVKRHLEAKPVAVESPAMVVLLPLSGPHASIGAELRSAISLAATESKVAITVLDTKGTPEGARAAVELAVSKHSAGAILGPVGQRESRAAAAKAAALGVAIGLLSPQETGATPSEGIFRLWPSREAQAAEAGRIAVALGYTAPAVLAPRDELGTRAAKAFLAAAKAAGATQARSGFYDPSATELEPDLKAFLGLVPLTNERLRRHLRRKGRKKGWKSFSPDIDFDLLYIPDSYDRAALVASYLPFFNVELRADELVDTLALRRKHGGRIPSIVQLLGNHEWHHPSLIARGGDAIDGALIAETCVGGPTEDYLDDDSAALAVRLRRAIGRRPSRLASQGYDVAKMLFERIGTGTKPSRALFVAARSTGGACGPAQIDATGQLRRESVLLRVEGDELVLHEW